MSRKLKILEISRKLFNASTTQASTTNHIAKEMGISAGNLHYHYSNREEIIRLLYKQMREKMTLSIDKLPKNIDELNLHQKVLINIQWEYRFFFREILFLFSRDNELKREYIKDNIAHRSRIKIVIKNLINHNQLYIKDDYTLEYIVDTMLMTWQFYTSYIQTLGKELSEESTQEAVLYSNNSLMPFYVLSPTSS